jgi:Leucine-rich repeat (LRR) protein
VAGYCCYEIDFNKKASIISEVTMPQYPLLQVLYLGDNNICSIEALQFLQAPKIEKLFLSTDTMR